MEWPGHTLLNEIARSVPFSGKKEKEAENQAGIYHKKPGKFLHQVFS